MAKSGIAIGFISGKLLALFNFMVITDCFLIVDVV